MASQGYRIEIEPHSGNITVFHHRHSLVKSDQVAVLRETRLPDCLYFPIDAVEPGILEASDHRTFCPFKGTASYWHVNTPEGKIENGAWSYLTPLAESAGLEGRLSFSGEVVDHYQFETPPQTGENNDGHINSPLSDWILREAGFCPTRREFVRALGRKFVEAGIAVYRMNITIWSLHPQIAGVNFLWMRDSDEVIVSGASYEIFKSPDYLSSPLNLVTKGLGGVRQPLDVAETEFQFSTIMEELKNQGATDYVAVPLRFSDGQFHSLTMALDHENGFTTENLGLVFECVGVISRYFEVLTLRNNTTTLLDTYLGKRTGQKVLSGDIRRGQDEDIQAVILFSDLTNSTLLAGELPRNEYLELLNKYFETVLGPINRNGGEVLKFIGDAVLAIFPISGDKDKTSQAESALSTAQEVISSITGNLGDNAGPQIDLGISLPIGDVTYGNVGGQDRLDFTVIGPAANLASRLESLCKSTGNRILMSQDFKQVLDGKSGLTNGFVSIGNHQLSGVSQMQEVFSPGS